MNPKTNIHIPLARPDIGEAEIQAVTRVLRTPYLSLGPKLVEFEDAIRRLTGAAHAVAVSSGTSGLHLCVRALGFQAGDEVITTPFSFIASANVLLFEGARPVFVDIDPNSLNLDPALVERALSPRTKGILAVHAFGYPAPLGDLVPLAKGRGLRLIEDACEAMGSRFAERHVGTLGHAGVFAFYPNKQITTGEGGVVITDSAELAAELRILRNQGRDPGGKWLDQVALGYNYRLSDIQCALGLAQLARLEAILAKRRRVAARYDTLLSGHPDLVLPVRPAPPNQMSWFVYVTRLAARFSRADRDRIVAGMAERGVQCGRYFAPIHLQPYYRERFGYRPGDFPHTEAMADRAVALPFFTGMGREQVETVCHHLVEVIAAQKRRP